MDLATFRKPLGAISYNALKKTYPDGSVTLLVASQLIFREPGWEEDKRRPPSPRGEGGPESGARSMRRARAALRDICRATPFSWFVTFTLNRECIDRYDMAAITRKLNAWLDNRVRRRGLCYVLVPERHKDGAVHFHGLINGALDGEMRPSGHKDAGGHDIYNLAAWGYGFSTAIRLYGDYRRAVGYVCKYIGKQTEKIGGRWYYSGGEIQRPAVERLMASYEDAEAVEGGYQFLIPELDARCVLLDLPAKS